MLREEPGFRRAKHDASGPIAPPRYSPVAEQVRGRIVHRPRRHGPVRTRARPDGRPVRPAPTGDVPATASRATVSGDADLVAQVRDGHDEPYAELYRRHQPAALALARTLTEHSAADDVVSEAFEKLLHRIRGGGGPEAAFRPYLLRTVRTVAVDASRRTRRLVVAEDPERGRGARPARGRRAGRRRPRAHHPRPGVRRPARALADLPVALVRRRRRPRRDRHDPRHQRRQRLGAGLPRPRRPAPRLPRRPPARRADARVRRGLAAARRRDPRRPGPRPAGRGRRAPRRLRPLPRRGGRARGGQHQVRRRARTDRAGRGGAGLPRRGPARRRGCCRGRSARRGTAASVPVAEARRRRIGPRRSPG